MSKLKKINTVYKLKNPTSEFFCALCRAPRQMMYQKNLTSKNYLQIVMVSVVAIWLLFPLMGMKSIFIFFLNWSIFEVVNKLLYRRELSCPHCAFDPTWYRRDVKQARKKVMDFFAEQNKTDLEEKMAPVPIRNPKTQSSQRENSIQ